MDETQRNKLLMVNMPEMTATKDGTMHHQISFPYTFPQPGKYRIWIQAKRNGKIINSAFDAEVKWDRSGFTEFKNLQDAGLKRIVNSKT